MELAASLLLVWLVVGLLAAPVVGGVDLVRRPLDTTLWRWLWAIGALPGSIAPVVVAAGSPVLGLVASWYLPMAAWGSLGMAIALCVARALRDRSEGAAFSLTWRPVLGGVAVSACAAGALTGPGVEVDAWFLFWVWFGPLGLGVAVWGVLLGAARTPASLEARRVAGGLLLAAAVQTALGVVALIVASVDFGFRPSPWGWANLGVPALALMGVLMAVLLTERRPWWVPVCGAASSAGVGVAFALEAVSATTRGAGVGLPAPSPDAVDLRSIWGVHVEVEYLRGDLPIGEVPPGACFAVGTGLGALCLEASPGPDVVEVRPEPGDTLQDLVGRCTAPGVTGCSLYHAVATVPVELTDLTRDLELPAGGAPTGPLERRYDCVEVMATGELRGPCEGLTIRAYAPDDPIGMVGHGPLLLRDGRALVLGSAPCQAALPDSGSDATWSASVERIRSLDPSLNLCFDPASTWTVAQLVEACTNPDRRCVVSR